ncbi:hypothetical protein GGI42DRAFT_340935 [Trichoderma sp. SZMC 28013]
MIPIHLFIHQKGAFVGSPTLPPTYYKILQNITCFMLVSQHNVLHTSIFIQVSIINVGIQTQFQLIPILARVKLRAYPITPPPIPSIRHARNSPKAKPPILDNNNKTSLLLYSRYLCKRFHLCEPIHAFPPANSYIRSTPGTGTTAKSTHQSRPSPRPTPASEETVVVSASKLPLGPPWYPIARLSAVYLAAAAPQSESS